MARKFKVRRKIHQANRQLSVYELGAKNSSDFAEKSKAAYFDYIQKLTPEERAQLFRYKADREKAMTLAWERLEFAPDEIAQKFGLKDWKEFKRKTSCWINGHNVDIGKMVSLITNGDGQQSNEGRRLKAQLEKLLNDQIEKDFFDVID